MTAPVWIQRETIVTLQEQLLAAFGGAAGLRDDDALRTALAEPPVKLTADEASVFALAASYCYQLIDRHPFVDGNLRLGFTTAVLFLELNGYRLRASDADAAVHTLAFAAKALDETDYTGWLQANARGVEAPAPKRPRVDD